MKDQIIKLKELEEKIEDALLIKKGIYSKAEEKASFITNTLTQLELERIELKKEIEVQILQKFKETAEKKYFGDIGIKEYKEINYDKDEAFKWAKEKDMFLKLDDKAFDKAAESLNLPFVKIEKKPKVTFPKIIKIEE